MVPERTAADVLPGIIWQWAGRARFLRICAGCVRNLGQVATGEADSLTVDRRTPARKRKTALESRRKIA